MDIENIIQSLQQELPPAFARKMIPKLLGGIIAKGTLANLDCKKQGPPRCRAGRTVIYQRESFLLWLRNYLATRQRTH